MRDKKHDPADDAGREEDAATELISYSADQSRVETLVIEESDELFPPVDDEDGPTDRVQGWRRIFRGNRALWVVAIVAIVCMAAGLLVGRFIISPADAAANSEPPKPGLITVPVEFGELSNDVTLRADVGYADSTELKLDTSSFDGAVVTGLVPEAGTEINALSKILEVGGRPVFVLPGELPMYRTMRFGVSGPDVVQLKQSLASLGIQAGDPASNVFDQALADGIAQLYAQIGYPVPPVEAGESDAYRSAVDGVRSAEQALNEAQKAANQGANQFEVNKARIDLNTAQKLLDIARAPGAVNPESGKPYTQQDIINLQNTVDQAKNALEAAQAVDNSGAKAAVDSAYAGLESAREAAEAARQAIQPYLPASEAVFLTNLPRRVDAVNVQRGNILSGEAAMSISGANVAVTANAAEADAKLLKVGDEATFEMPDGTPHRAVISELKPGTADSPRWALTLTPDPLTAEQMQLLQGQNVRMVIKVGATEGEVLIVPIAALTAGPNNESRVEVVTGDPKDGAQAETKLVVVTTGLAAGGSIEVKPTDGELEEGDLVVVGE